MMIEMNKNPLLSFYESTKEFMNLNSREKMLMDTNLYKQISLT